MKLSVGAIMGKLVGSGNSSNEVPLPPRSYTQRCGRHSQDSNSAEIRKPQHRQLPVFLFKDISPILFLRLYIYEHINKYARVYRANSLCSNVQND